MSTKPQSSYKPSVSHLADANFEGFVHRDFFGVRDLGVKDATDGEFSYYISRAKDGDPVSTGWHYHGGNLQVIYCLAGWEVIGLEDGTTVRLVPGSCMNIPPGYVHNELSYSADMEMLILRSPSEVTTTQVSVPEAWA